MVIKLTVKELAELVTAIQARPTQKEIVESVARGVMASSVRRPTCDTAQEDKE